MRKGLILFKRLVAIFLVLLFGINTFAALVGDNDGAAFITKAEFDSMKNDFQSQLDRYNKSIDNKVDGAIASYLAGLRVASQIKLELDRNCNYVFPMTCYFDSTTDLWNDEHSRYYRCSVPRCLVRTIRTSVGLRNSTGSMTSEASIVGQNSYGPFTARANHRGSDINKNILRIGYGDDTDDFPGRSGNLYRIEKNDARTRVINGVSHDVWVLNDVLVGQDYIYYILSGLGGAYDGLQDTLRPWLDFIFMGYNTCAYTSMPYSYSKWNTSSNGANPNAWTSKVLKCSYLHSQISSGVKAEANWNRNNWSSMADAMTIYNSITTSNVDSGNWNNSTLLETPWVRVLSADKTGENNMIFAGDSNLPAYNVNGFSFAPRPRTTYSETKVAHSHVTFGNHDTIAIYNFSSSNAATSVYQNVQYKIWPEWHATEQSSLDQDTNDDFSMIPASRVCYTDYNGKEHFMDEGMFLGTYEQDGDVMWKMHFDSTETNTINYVLSKKPLDFNRTSSDYPKFSYKIGSTETYVPAGSIVRLSTNEDITINVPDIFKGDELYMIWWPDNKEYVELSNFFDYYISA